MMIFQHSFQIFEKKAVSPKRHPKFFWMFKVSKKKKTGVTWFGVSTPPPPLFSTGGRRTTMNEWAYWYWFDIFFIPIYKTPLLFSELWKFGPFLPVLEQISWSVHLVRSIGNYLATFNSKLSELIKIIYIYIYMNLGISRFNFLYIRMHIYWFQ